MYATPTVTCGQCGESVLVNTLHVCTPPTPKTPYTTEIIAFRNALIKGGFEQETANKLTTIYFERVLL